MSITRIAFLGDEEQPFSHPGSLPYCAPSNTGLPVALHADDRDAVLAGLVERLDERAQPEVAVVGELALGVVMVDKQRKPRARPGLV